MARTEPKKGKVPPEPIPVSFLKKLFSKSPGGMSALQRRAKCVFSKPSPEAIESYSVRAVRAIRERNVPMLRSMMEEGVSMDACNRFGESLIHMACRRGDVSVVLFLIMEGRVNVNVRDDYGRTPMHDACWTPQPNFDVMHVLLEHVPVELLICEDVRGHSPFHYSRLEHGEAWLNFLRERETKIECLLNQVVA
jgi:ankyrin repeat protein